VRLQWVCLLIATVVLAPFAFGAQHMSSYYRPLSSSEIGQPFRLKPLGFLNANSATIPSRAGISGSVFRVRRTTNGGALELEGKDRASKTWKVDILELWGCAGGARIYEADLDADTVQDAVISMATCGNGLAPSAHLVAITFDTAGRPVIFEAEGYFENKTPGIDSLVDMNHDGKAELVFMNFNDGYWITNIYSVEDGRWAKLNGPFAGRAFPLYTRFTTKTNNRAVIPPPSRHPWAPDLSNTKQVFTGVIISWKWPDEYLRSEPAMRNLQLTLLAGGKQVVCSPEYWFDAARLVLDRDDGRTIGHLERKTVDSILQELTAKKVPIHVYGQRSSDHCSPALVWAAIH